MTKIAITISYTKNWKELAEITIPNTAEYCTRHGYSLFVTVEEEYDKYTGLEKLRNIKTLLPHFDVVFSMDCDSIITNHNRMIEDYINGEGDFFVAEGLNCGVFAIKNTTFGTSFIHYATGLISSRECHCEQDCLEKYMDKHPSNNNIRILPHPSINSYMSELYPEIPQPVTEEQGQWVAGKSFICHLPAMGINKRAEIMRTIKITK